MKKLTLFSVVGTLLITSVGLWLIFFYRNFHVVIPNQVYRSAQLPPKLLTHVIEKHHIASIIDLEGGRGKPWYAKEMDIAKKYDLHFYTMRLNAHHAPSRTLLLELTNVLLTAPKPILIHCRRGADRTGLASAMALILNNNKDLSRIQAQYSLRYLALSPTSTGKLVIPEYLSWLAQNRYTTSKDNFMTWTRRGAVQSL